jgi:XTP/dITP diphosphohydrolase
MRPGRLLLATGNAKKLRELRQILEPFRLEVLAPSDLDYDPDVVEDGATFEANAVIKAQAGVAHTGEWTLADDSGLEARALDWRPGVHSARYAGEPRDDAANNRKLVAELTPHSDKYVRFRCVIVLCRPGEPPLTWAGVFPGLHLAQPRGDGGFGYDPHVLIPELGKTVAELDAAEKHARSHRGQALRQFTTWLAQQR